MSFLKTKLYEEKSYRVSPNVAPTFSNQLRKRHVASNLSDRVSRALVHQSNKNVHIAKDTVCIRLQGLSQIVPGARTASKNYYLSHMILHTVRAPGMIYESPFTWKTAKSSSNTSKNTLM